MAASTDPDMQAAARTFFSKSNYAVAGASSNPSKFGHKIFQWYLARDLPVTPLNPASSITANGTEYPTVSSVADLKDPSDTALSVITPPAVTAKLLKEAKEAGIQAVWLQPGAFGDAELQYAWEAFPGGAIGGFASGTRGGEGWCVLVDGDSALKAATREKKL